MGGPCMEEVRNELNKSNDGANSAWIKDSR